MENKTNGLIPQAIPGGEKVAVMYSGGLDSTVIVAELQAKGYIVIPICFDDNSIQYQTRRAPAIEILMQKMGLYDSLITAKMYEVERLRVNDGTFGFIPGWKAILQMTAMAYCQHNKCVALYTGYNSDNFVGGYVDELPESIDAVTELYNKLYQTNIQVHYPYFNETKGEMIRVGALFNVPFEFTDSCMMRQLPGLNCGTCETCQRRKRAFAEAGVVDNTQYYFTGR